MMHTKQLKLKLGGAMVVLSLFTFSVPSMADEVVYDVTTYCSNFGTGSEGQFCDPPYTFDVTTDNLLQLDYSVPPAHCSSIRLNISVDGGVPITTEFLGWNGDPDAQPLQTGPINIDVAPGQHNVSLQAEGKEGGCNAGSLGSWGGTLKVNAASPQVTIEQNLGGMLTGMAASKSTVSCQNMSSRPRQKVTFSLPPDARAWDCKAAGLIVNPGDKIKQTIMVTGPAD